MSTKSKWFLISAGAISLLILIAFLVPMFTWKAYRSPIVIQLTNLHQVCFALRDYAANHGGNFPAHISDLPAGSIPDEGRQFHDPATKETHDWLYFAGHKIDEPGRTVLAASTVETFHDCDVRAHNGGDRIVTFVDGTAEIIPETEFQKILAAQHQ